VNGFLVPPGNHYELAKAIGYFAKNKGQIKQMGEFSRMRVKKYYPQQVFSELEKIYQSLL
jgi:glycosyltransferase involved in cell wall biosynthesis